MSICKNRAMIHGMNPTQTLPESYRHCYTLDSSQHKVLQVILACVGLGAFFLGWQILNFASPALMNLLKLGRDRSQLVLFAATIVVMILLHEAIHALALWFFTRSFPSFGITRMGSVYVNASNWYLPRIPALVMALSPLLALSTIGAVLSGFASGLWLKMLLWAILLNMIGAINDLAVAVWVFFQPATVLIKNSGLALSIYRIPDDQNQKTDIRAGIRGFMEHYLIKLP